MDRRVGADAVRVRGVDDRRRRTRDEPVPGREGEAAGRQRRGKQALSIE